MSHLAYDPVPLPLVVQINEKHARAGKAWLERSMVGGRADVVGADIPVCQWR
jgi:hypothetical protein